MFLALAPDGSRYRAARGRAAVCPSCGVRMLPKCGDVLSHHWAHERGADCDRWSEGETEWHLNWKIALAPEDRWEIRTGNHRADIITRYDRVIELQHSSIAAETIAEREDHYLSAHRALIWLFDGSTWAIRLRHDRGFFWPSCHFSWERPHLALSVCRAPIFVDLLSNPWAHSDIGPSILEIVKADWAPITRGRGFAHHVKTFCRHHGEPGHHDSQGTERC